MEQNSTEVKGHSLNIIEARLKAILDIVPEASVEGKLDIEALKRSLGLDNVLSEGERYVLNWAGKSDAYKVLQVPTSATLKPQRELSDSFDRAQHVFIEGENLEVLKVLQKSYFGEIGLIYLDPPYNTGSDYFLYPDKFKETKDEYLKRTNEVNEEGILLREGLFRKNSRENGHFHSNWLSMMLPRLYLSRDLLKDDGLIFVSCDDNEVHNLRCLMNEVFGEENFIAQQIWKKSYGGGAKIKHVVVLHEYVLCYARNKNSINKLELPPDPKMRKYYKLKDDKFPIRGKYRLQPLATNSMDERENLRYPIKHEGEEIWPEKQWQWEESRVLEAIKNDELVFSKNEGTWTVNYKQYLKDENGVERGAKPYSIIDGPYTQVGTDEIKQIFGDGKVFPFPKPKDLLKYFLSFIYKDKNAFVLDFFAGSCSMAQALIEFNQEMKTNFKLVCVQLEELCEEGKEAKKAGFNTIADIGRARIKHTIQSLRDATKDAATDVDKNLGLKCFKLSSSNFKQWQGENIETEQQLVEQIELFYNSNTDKAEEEDLFYELLLKFGQTLTTEFELLKIDNCNIYAFNNRKIMYLIHRFTEGLINWIISEQPKELVALDSVFENNDELKTNLGLQCRDANIRFICI